MRPFKGNLQILKSFNSRVINNNHRCIIDTVFIQLEIFENFTSAENGPQTNFLKNAYVIYL